MFGGADGEAGQLADLEGAEEGVVGGGDGGENSSMDGGFNGDLDSSVEGGEDEDLDVGPAVGVGADGDERLVKLVRSIGTKLVVWVGEQGDRVELVRGLGGQLLEWVEGKEGKAVINGLWNKTRF